MTIYKTLREANAARQKLWDPDGKITLGFRCTELGEEVGEFLGAMKRLQRFAFGMRGGKPLQELEENIKEEYSDILMVLNLIMEDIGMSHLIVDTPEVRKKFNETSRKFGFDCFVEIF